MSVCKKEFGMTKDGRQVYLYTISSENGMEAAVTDYGAILVNLIVPDRQGVKKDLVLGYDNLSDYEENSCFFGATIGRNANRIGGASFQIDGVTYKLEANENGNNLHTDFYHGFHKVLWKAEILEEEQAVKFSYVSPDGENGFPGTLHISVTYALLPDMGLQITYDGVSDKKTMINVTNHSYFNLGGHDAGVSATRRLRFMQTVLQRFCQAQFPQEKFCRWKEPLWICGQQNGSAMQSMQMTASLSWFRDMTITGRLILYTER